jgi:N-dimethylarginine dimethylaminohydrolase
LEVFPDSVFVGLFERTDQQGFEWLQSILEAWGYRVRSVRTPAGAVHLKSDCCVLGGDTALATRRLAAPANRVRCSERIPGQVRPSS